MTRRSALVAPARTRDADARGLLLESANAAATVVATEAFAKLAGHAMELTSSALGRRLRPEDQPGLLCPVDVVVGGRECFGAILALSDRAILAWTVGMSRVRTFEAVVPMHSIEAVQLGTRAGGTLSKDRETLEIITGDAVWRLVFAAVEEAGNRIAPIVGGRLEGSMGPVHASE